MTPAGRTPLAVLTCAETAGTLSSASSMSACCWSDLPIHAMCRSPFSFCEAVASKRATTTDTAASLVTLPADVAVGSRWQSKDRESRRDDLTLNGKETALADGGGDSCRIAFALPRGVRTLSCAVTSAPFSRSSRTVSTWPWWAAQCSAVAPSCAAEARSQQSPPGDGDQQRTATSVRDCNALGTSLAAAGESDRSRRRTSF